VRHDVWAGLEEKLRSLDLQTLVPGERGASHGGLQIQGGDARTIEQVYDLPAVGD
jgi:hypothetical protein